ncbi:MAG: hypothetical protein SGI88_14110 [Candidatus Hydrogenedentes bacterium]|nr:hypothetical protein [Candidatus Hydrogenedentota bacterium]
MNEQFERLNDYLDGVLSGEEALEIEAELERDPALRAEAQALRALIDEAARLPKGVAPRRDLWTGIDARLTGRAPANPRLTIARIRQGLLAVAAAALIFAAGVWYARTTDSESGQNPGGQVANVQQPGPVIAISQTAVNSNAQAPVQFAGYQEIAAEYAGVRTTLREALNQARPNLAPETVLVIDDSLSVIDQAIRDIEVALDNDPGNRALMQSLVAVYDQEVGLLRQATRLADSPGENA